MSNNGTLPNTCIDQHSTSKSFVGLYHIWSTFGGGYIVRASIDGNPTRDLFDSETDARRSYNGWVDAMTAQAEYRDEAGTTAGLLQF